MREKQVSKEILWITKTAIFTAILIIIQVATAPLGNTLITGSGVNMILIVSVMILGLSSGVTIAVISPILAKLLGIGPLWALIPFIMVGNLVFVIIWHLIGKKDLGNKEVTSYIVALIVAALAKFAALYLGVVKIAIPIIIKLPEPQATAISAMFSIPQLVTAVIGGVIAITLIQVLKQAIGADN
jgi:Protein of unknown function (DUF1393).